MSDEGEKEAGSPPAGDDTPGSPRREEGNPGEGVQEESTQGEGNTTGAGTTAGDATGSEPVALGDITPGNKPETVVTTEYGGDDDTYTAGPDTTDLDTTTAAAASEIQQEPETQTLPEPEALPEVGPEVPQEVAQEPEIVDSVEDNPKEEDVRPEDDTIVPADLTAGVVPGFPPSNILQEHVPLHPGQLQGGRRFPSHKRTLASGTSSKPSMGLPSLAPSQAEIGRIPSAGRHRRDVQTPKPSRESTRIRNVPNVVKMATVTAASARARPETPPEYYQSGHYGEGVRRFRKVVSWDEAQNARPPLRIDMDGPTPWSYSPIVKPLKETNAPAWSFGRRCFVEKRGGARKSWEKSWFHTNDVWKMKTDFVDEVVWPTPMHYAQRPTLGPRQSTKLNYPSYSCGIRRSMSINKKGSHREPAPNDYDKDRADKCIYKRAPSFTHSHRNGGTALWNQGKDCTPGPGSYDHDQTFIKKHKPSFSIVGIRREKEHQLGPFATF